MIAIEADIPEAGYGKKVVLKRVSLSAAEGDTVALIGPNGAGKSTLLKVLMGFIKIQGGSITINGVDTKNRSPEENVRNGISFVPQGNRVFTELSVRENLEIGGYLIKTKQDRAARMDELLQMFPELSTRMKQNAGKLSGGEKQQLALARALMLKPKVLLMDEPSLGLAPKLVTKALEAVKQISLNQKTTVLIVEQKVHDVCKIADWVLGLRLGEIVFNGTPAELSLGDRLKNLFLV